MARLYKYFFYDKVNNRVNWCIINTLKNLPNNLEVTTRGTKVGRVYSPFNMTLDGNNLESMYHSCKILQDTDNKYSLSPLASLSPTDSKAKVKVLHKKFGFAGFSYNNRFWDITYKSAFYAYIYTKSFIEMEYDIKELALYDTFSDMFNTSTTDSGQANSCAFLIYLYNNNYNLNQLINNPDLFCKVYLDAHSPIHLFTSYYSNPDIKQYEQDLVSISYSEPYEVKSKLTCYAPSKILLDSFKSDNIDNGLYEHFYLDTLSQTPHQVIPENSILLCWEEPDKFCHRHILSNFLNNFCNYNCKELNL